MATHKIAITIPPDTLRRVDGWSKKMKKSRSQFIVEQVERRLRELEDAEVTRLYDETYKDNRSLRENQELAEEMLRLAPEGRGDEDNQRSYRV